MVVIRHCLSVYYILHDGCKAWTRSNWHEGKYSNIFNTFQSLPKSTPYSKLREKFFLPSFLSSLLNSEAASRIHAISFPLDPAVPFYGCQILPASFSPKRTKEKEKRKGNFLLAAGPWERGGGGGGGGLFIKTYCRLSRWKSVVDTSHFSRRERKRQSEQNTIAS